MFTSFKLWLASALIGIAGSLVGINYGAFNFVSSGTYTLAGGGISSSDTSIAVDNFLQPISLIPYTMATDFGSIGYITLEPGSATNKEFASFTGISYSGNRATLTGVTRGLSFSSPYTASSTLRKSHAGGTKVIVSNPPQLYNQLATKQNNESILGLWTFSSTSLPVVDFNPNAADWTASASTTFATKGYVDDTNNTGASNSNETTAGVVELATAAEAAAGTSSGGTGARLVPPASIFSSTCSGTIVPVTTGGKLSQGCLDLTAAFSVTGLWNFVRASSTRFSVFDTLYVGGSATTTIQGSSTGTSTIQGFLNVAGTNSTSTISGRLAVSATTTLSGCAGCLSSYEIVTNTVAAPTGNTNTASQTATCTAGKRVIGGGVSGIPQSGGGTVQTLLQASYPSANNTWTATVYCATGSSCASGTITVHAICVYP